MASVTHVVGPEHAAPALGSGDVAVFATPMLLAWCEEATCVALPLPPEQTSVGTRVSVDHLVASPVGATVTASAEIIARDGRMVTFRVEAVDDSGALIGTGEVRRVIVDRDRFMDRLRQL